MRKYLLLLLFLGAFSLKSQTLEPKSKVFVDFIVEESSVDPSDALDMFKKEITKLTSLSVEDEKKNSDFEIKLQVLKAFGDLRKARFEIFDKSGDKIYETKWQKAGSTFQYGMSGTRGAIVISIKKQLLKKYPNIKW